MFFIKESPRLINKFKKSLYKKQEIVTFNKNRDTVKIKDGRTFKRKRLFVTDVPIMGQK